MRRLIWIAATVLVLVGAGIAVAHDNNGKSIKQVSAAFTAGTASNVRTDTCTAADGTYASSRGDYTGTATSTEPTLNGKASVECRKRHQHDDGVRHRRREAPHRHGRREAHDGPVRRHLQERSHRWPRRRPWLGGPVDEAGCEPLGRLHRRRRLQRHTRRQRHGLRRSGPRQLGRLQAGPDPEARHDRGAWGGLRSLVDLDHGGRGHLPGSDDAGNGCRGNPRQRPGRPEVHGVRHHEHARERERGRQEQRASQQEPPLESSGGSCADEGRPARRPLVSSIRNRLLASALRTGGTPEKEQQNEIGELSMARYRIGLFCSLSPSSQCSAGPWPQVPPRP